MKEMIICPIVICGQCFHAIDIQEWLKGFETSVGNCVPHPNSSHRCNHCGYLWEPESGSPGNKMISAEEIMFFWKGRR